MLCTDEQTNHLTTNLSETSEQEQLRPMQ